MTHIFASVFLLFSSIATSRLIEETDHGNKLLIKNGTLRSNLIVFQAFKASFKAH